MNYKSEMLQTLQERGFLYQISHGAEFDDFCAQHPITAYVGFDATAPSLQVGNLMMLMLSLWIRKMGGKIILLVGGGTTKIGDPSWRDKMRPLLSQEQINQNILGLKDSMMRVVGEDVMLVDNAQWLDSLAYIPFLREIGVHFSVNRMLALDHVRSRLDQDQPLSFLEFNYPIMQGYDFLELFRRYGCNVQFGGSDQWGNIVTGVDLVKRVTGKTVYGVTTPLLKTASGTKMGKTAQGTIWLNADLTSPYEYWQFWRNSDDKDVIPFLKLYTLLPLSDIEKLGKLQDREINIAKKVLADETTTILHGAHWLEEIHRTTECAFSSSEKGGDLLPHYIVEEPVSLSSVLKGLGFVSSLSEGKRKIREGAVKINGRVIQEENFLVLPEDCDSSMVSLGHKRHARLLYKTSL